MFLPLTAILGIVFWLFITWVKRRIIQSHSKKWEIDSKVLEGLIKDSNSKGKKTAQEILEDRRKRREAEEQEKIKNSLGKTIFDEIDERRNGTKQPKPRTFDPKMFEDSISRLYFEDKKMFENDCKTSTKPRKSTKSNINNN